MASTEKNGDQSSFSLSAGALTQLLAAFACFLGAFVLPLTVREFRGTTSRTVLLALGTVMLILGTGSLFFGRRFSRLLTRAGKRSRVVVPREGLGYLAIMLTLAVGALLGQRNMPLLVFGMMAGPFILNGWIVYGMLKGISVSRGIPDRAAVGEYVVVEMTVRNSKRLLASHLLEVRDQISGAALARSKQDYEGTITFVRVPPREQRVGRYQICFAKRGRYTFGPARVSSRFPLGIGERGQILPDTSELIVHPEIGKLLPAWRRQQKELAESSHRVRSQRGLFDDEFHRIREYRTGDNPRSIHWRSSARRGALMIREFQQNRRADSLVVLDLPDLPEWSEVDAEMAISLAATICVEQSRASSGGSFLLAVSASENILIRSRFPGGFREESLDALAVCQRSTRADLKSLLQQVLTTQDMTDERIILITPRPNVANEALAELSRERRSDRVDPVLMTTVIVANAESMQQVYSREAATPGKQTNNISSAGGGRL